MGDDCCGPPDPVTKVPLWKYLALMLLMCGGAFQMIGPLLGGVSTLMNDMPPLFGEKHYIELTADSPELSQIFFSGEPWLILCNPPKNSVAPAWIPAAEYLEKEHAGAFSMAVLDCSKLLPSGKSTYERFKLTPPGNYQAHALLVYNGKAPKLVTHGLSDNSPYSVANFVTGLARKTKFSWPSLTSTKELEAKCVQLKLCVLVLHNGKMTGLESELMMGLAQKYRTVRWARMDLFKTALSLEGSLPGGAGEEFVDHSPRLLVFKRRKVGQEEEDTATVLTAKTYKGSFSADNMAAFLGTAVKDDGASWAVVKQQLTAVKRTEFNTNLYATKTAKVEL